MRRVSGRRGRVRLVLLLCRRSRSGGSSSRSGGSAARWGSGTTALTRHVGLVVGGRGGMKECRDGGIQVDSRRTNGVKDTSNSYIGGKEEARPEWKRKLRGPGFSA